MRNIRMTPAAGEIQKALERVAIANLAFIRLKAELRSVPLHKEQSGRVAGSIEEGLRELREIIELLSAWSLVAECFSNYRSGAELIQERIEFLEELLRSKQL